MNKKVEGADMGRTSDVNSSRESIDIAIITVIPVELNAVKKVFGAAENFTRTKDEVGTIYLEGAVFSELKRTTYTIVICCLGNAGNTSSAAATSRTIERYKPKAVILSGIAAGIRGKVKIGNVVIVDRVIAYESGAFLSHEGKKSLEPRPEMSRINHSISQDLSHFSPSKEELTSKFLNLGGQFPIAQPGKELEYRDLVADHITLRSSAAASGEKLLRDPEKLQNMRSKMHGKIEVGEMEAAGFVEACRPGNVDWTMFRGVSDFGDQFKDDEFQEFAATAAAVVMKEFISTALDLQASSSTSGETRITELLAERKISSDGTHGPHNNFPRSQNTTIKRLPTEKQRDDFLIESFVYMREFFQNSLEQLKKENAEIDTSFEEIDSNRFSATVYRNGKALSRCKITLNGPMGNGISYSSSVQAYENSMNEQLSVQMDPSNNLFLKLLGLAMYEAKKEYLTKQGAAECFWSILLRPLQR